MEELQYKTNYLLSYNLQFFAEESAGEKTEEATSKKLKDARSEGQVAKSKELTIASSLATLFLTLKLSVGFIGERFLKQFYESFFNLNSYVNDGFNINAVQRLLINAVITILLSCLPVFLAAMFVAFIVNLIQVKWHISGKVLRPKFNKINPFKGFKKLFSKDKLPELIIETIKIVMIAYIAYDSLKNEWPTLFKLYDYDLEQGMMLVGDLVIDLGLKISMIYLVLGFADLYYQKKKFKKDMRMTKQEIKDEYKQVEGDPHIKNKIRSKMREVSQKRMMQALPKADVVITNPTHLAAAIKYDKESAEAPVLIAKGADFVAQKIKEVAKENNITIVENKPLARMLYYNVEIGAEIPPELYQMTAEVLAYVYGLKNN